MSDTYLRLIPTDPAYVPQAALADVAQAALARLVPEADEITAITTDEIAFIDQGANFDRVVCPTCNRDLDQEWWKQAMTAAGGKSFATLEVSVPCCGATVSLNDLHYEGPAGFARFVLAARNPKISDLREDQVATLSGVLATPLRKIWAHY